LIKAIFAQNPDENDPRKYMIPAKKAVKEAAIIKMIMLGSVGKANDAR
jgi:tagatose 1,6-diphosphate aldolase GatY/KbaY